MAEVIDFKPTSPFRVKIESGPFFISYVEGPDGKAIETGFLTYGDWEGGKIPHILASPAERLANVVFADHRRRDERELHRKNIYLELPLN